MSQIEQKLFLEKDEVRDFASRNEAKLLELEKQFNARIVLRGNVLKVIGTHDEVESATDRIKQILEVQRKGGGLSPTQFRQAVRHSVARPGRTRAATTAVVPTNPGDNGEDTEGYDKPLSELFLDGIPVPLKRRRLSPITPGQKRYIDMIRKKDIVFGIGPAGTGKTYLAVAMAVSMLISGKVSRIILCRPAVEAGEKLGFLPGDLQEKLNPYVRPLYDALYEMMDAEKIRQALETGVIEIAPLAFMRGRTLNNAFVILDEGQNTTPEQMKMFLTRLGFESKAVITGDVTQIDLPNSARSGLIQVQRVLGHVDDIGFVHFNEVDVVRHDLVMKIIRAYEQFDNAGQDPKEVGNKKP
ncbi:MAG: PhoH family protein [Candidatus Sumerlaeia bacterium]|nr:PhoH family protein [Candidatus Sumerlaeia bacterium]